MAYDAEQKLSGRDKLLIIADVIENLGPDEHLLLSTWRSGSCGCVLGWAISGHRGV